MSSFIRKFGSFCNFKNFIHNRATPTIIFQSRDSRISLTRLHTSARQTCPSHRGDRVIGRDIQTVYDGHLDYYYRKSCYEEPVFNVCPRLHENMKIYGKRFFLTN